MVLRGESRSTRSKACHSAAWSTTNAILVTWDRTRASAIESLSSYSLEACIKVESFTVNPNSPRYEDLSINGV